MYPETSSLRPETLPLSDIQLIEASAGTGKTWTIAALYIRLILGHGNAHTGFGKPLLPRDILVVTFTEAATAELRERIRKRLTEAARYFRKAVDAPEDTFLDTLAGDYDASAWPGLAHRLAVAADGMDEASIFTIHGWCSRMLKQHAFDSGAPFLINIEGESSALLKACVRDFWRVVFYPLDENECRLIQAAVNTPEVLAQKISQLLKETPEALARLSENRGNVVADLAGFRQALENHRQQQQDCDDKVNKARDLWATERSAIEQVLNTAKTAGHLNGNSYREFEQRLNLFKTWAEQGEPQPKTDWIGLFSAGGFKLNKPANNIEPQHPVFTQLAQLQAALEKAESSANQFHQAILTTATFWVRDHFAATKTRKATLDYDDLIHQLHAALRRESAGERLARIIRTQYPVAMIDEFQDTDAVQYDIFERIYGQTQSSTAWLMIGDPKQAIYGFRGADIHTYLRARQRDDKTLKPHTLGTNYRSTHDLVEAVNRMFSFAESHPGGAFLFKSEHDHPIPFQAVLAQGRKEYWVRQGQSAKALTCWYYPPSGNADKAIGVTEYRRVMAEKCANEIACLLQESTKGQAGFQPENASIEPLRESDIAILVRDGTEARSVRQALLRRGIRSVYLSDRDSVFDSQEAADLQQCLRAFLSPQDGRLIRAALGTSLLCLDYPQIERLSIDEAVLDQAIQHFIRYGELWNSQGVLAAVRQFIMDQQLPARLLAKPGGERTLTNLLHLSELLQTEGVHRDGPEGLLSYLQEMRSNDETNAEDNIIRLESDQGLIRVVTVHKSKGLEYPLVFLPFVCGYKETKRDKLSHYKYHDDAGQVVLDMAEVDENANSPSLQAMDKERLQEELRLLYVALTRARHACWLGIAPIKHGNSKVNALHKGAMGYLLSGGTQMADDEVGNFLKTLLDNHSATVIVDITEDQTIDFKPESNNKTETGKPRHFQAEPFTHWWIASYSALVDGLTGAGKDAEAAPADTTTPHPEEPQPPRQATARPEAGDTARIEQGNEEARISRINDVGNEGMMASRERDHPGHEAGGTPARPGQMDGPPILDDDFLHEFPAGTDPGTFLHSLLQGVALRGFDQLAGDQTTRSGILANRLKRSAYTDWQDKLDSWLQGFLTTDFMLGQQRLALCSLTSRECLTEMEFWFQATAVGSRAIDAAVRQHILPEQPRPVLSANTLNGMMRGFIDLVFRHQGQYYVVDYKSNRLGRSDTDYEASKLNHALLEHRYDLQYSLYLLALHRYLKARLGAAYCYDEHIGGAVYFFLRGLNNPATRGVYHHKPPRQLIESLDALFRATPHAEVENEG